MLSGVSCVVFLHEKRADTLESLRLSCFGKIPALMMITSSPCNSRWYKYCLSFALKYEGPFLCINSFSVLQEQSFPEQFAKQAIIWLLCRDAMSANPT